MSGETAAMSAEEYRRFLDAKAAVAPQGGIIVTAAELNPHLKPHARVAAQWAMAGGRRAIFSAFGLQKTTTQLEIMRLMLKHHGGKALIVCPLGVRQEFIRDAQRYFPDEYALGPRFIRRTEDAADTGLYLTNYESVREGKLDPRSFTAVSLDEASCLRGLGGTKTFREMMGYFEGSGIYRFVATATPSPNDYIELLAYSAFLDVMQVSEAKTRFFKRNSEKADHLTIMPSKAREFWLWVCTWALFITKPSDVDPAFSDEGYDLPPLDVRWHEVPSDHDATIPNRDGQPPLFPDSAIGLVEASREKRASMATRISKMLDLIREAPDDHVVLWHDLEDERRAIKAAVPATVEVYGTQDLEERERRVLAFGDGEIKYLASKPILTGSGTNLQHHCHRELFLGISYKFNDLIQAIHRVYRFGQTQRVRIDLIYSEAEREIKRRVEQKWLQHNELVRQMTAIVREYGLTGVALAQELRRSIGVQRQEVSGRAFRLIQNDSIEECTRLEGDSVHLILTSIPFSTMYEYSPSLNDFGHNETNEAFWAQMDFLTPHLYRVLKPGRMAVIHVKDRIVPGGINGLGFQTVYPFHCDAITHYQRHGFAYLGMHTVATDVVRENAQTYRLGWSEQCKDGSRMGCGMPEYLLLFRKPPTDRSNGYADEPVLKAKPESLTPDGRVIPYDYDAGEVIPGTGYSRARWQIDAHGVQRSSGNGLLTIEEIQSLPHAEIYKRWRAESLSHIYDYERHVRLGEELERDKRLPSGFMLMPPHSRHQNVWTDVARMRSLNMTQQSKGRELHLCPLQFDIVERVINQLSMPGEKV
ncbi:MAG: DNA methylase N-4, partial [Candidatus Omnitrophota bacterium]|nr:DNA methylase N-4 [Candidatus Omnitrophota bacterium]